MHSFVKFTLIKSTVHFSLKNIYLLRSVWAAKRRFLKFMWTGKYFAGMLDHQSSIFDGDKAHPSVEMTEGPG
jgi:hypothetical protein